MKFILALLFAFCYVECRKVVSINKNANVDFINMESGGAPPRPAQPTNIQVQAPTKPPTVTPTTAKPVVQPITVKTPVQPAQPQPPSPSPITPKPVQPTRSTNPITTPGPGSVKQLVNFYDSQGKGSPIRPYSYSTAVKQG